LLVDAIIRAGADVHGRPGDRYVEWGQVYTTPLEFARARGIPEVVELIVSSL
jgi:hypothetical protein